MPQKHSWKALEDMLSEYAQIVEERRELTTITGDEQSGKKKKLSYRTHRWIKRFRTADHIPFCSECNRSDPENIDIELSTLLAISEFGLTRSRVRDIEDAIDNFSPIISERLTLAKALRLNGSAVLKGLVQVSQVDEPFQERRLNLSARLRMILLSEERDAFKVSLKSRTDIEAFLRELTATGHDRAQEVHGGSFFRSENKIEYYTYKFDRLLEQATCAILSEPGTGLNDLIAPFSEDKAQTALLLLLSAKAYGLYPPDSEHFLGKNLIGSISDSMRSYSYNLNLLRVGGDLFTCDFIRISTADSELISDTATGRETAIYELTPKACERLLGNDYSRTAERVPTGMIKPRVSLNDLVISNDTRAAVEMALAQVENESLIFDDWGLSKSIPYGQGVTILFSGPPGTGKTATAEAIATALGKNLCVVDYSKLLNCMVGATEKHVVEVFQRAKDTGSVLFFDEADSMLSSREDSVRRYEVSETNVLLQSIEAFDGVCIFSTNRLENLDSALDRRISIKVPFKRPSEKSRKLLWEKMIPHEMPIDEDVDFTELAKSPLSGGQIKNIILNAARIAVRYYSKRAVSMAAFRQALEMETQGSWSHTILSERIGFKPDRRNESNTEEK